MFLEKRLVVISYDITYHKRGNCMVSYLLKVYMTFLIAKVKKFFAKKKVK